MGDALLSPQWVLVRLEAASAEEVIRQLAAPLVAAGRVRPSFVDAVLERERTNPTGLPLSGALHVAIPHTEVEHVCAPALAVATLARPVAFRSMVRPEETVSVSIVILLALTEPHAQIEMLMSLAELFQDPDRVRAVYEACSAEELIQRLNAVLERRRP
ncbi:MAG: PTS sugar transporter subunit IIA [Thermoflexus sp.]|uniref:PTS sugar transporter subunit IIA n=1 Tax=Thermoflexus sp. TaxID=1969742 RepID=UPI00332467E6